MFVVSLTQNSRFYSLWKTKLGYKLELTLIAFTFLNKIHLFHYVSLPLRCIQNDS